MAFESKDRRVIDQASNLSDLDWERFAFLFTLVSAVQMETDFVIERPGTPGIGVGDCGEAGDWILSSREGRLLIMKDETFKQSYLRIQEGGLVNVI